MCELSNSVSEDSAASSLGEAVLKRDSAIRKKTRTTYFSLASEDTLSSAGQTSVRSSCSSSACSGTFNSCYCFEVQVTSTPMSFEQEDSALERESDTKICCGSNFSSASEERGGEGVVAPQPSLKMIRRLKRMSDVWSKLNVSRCSDDVITDRLKRGREEAKKKQSYIEDLLNEASAQHHIQQQAQALLQLCSDEISVDEIEAERIILLAGERYKAYREEAERIVTEVGSSFWDKPQQSTESKGTLCPATIYISDIKLKLSADFSSHLQESPRDHSHHFLCLLKEKKTKGIIATQIISIHGHTSTQALHYSNLLTLPEIPPNFTLVIEVYHMSNEERLRNKKKILQRMLSSVKRVPSIKRYRYLSCTSNLTADIDQDTVQHKEDPIRSNFEYVGNTVLTREKLLSSHKHEICESELASSVELVVNADPLYLETHSEGYLNVYITKEWERRWFVLKDTTLSCWLYPDLPQKQESPLCEWDISDCHKLAHSASSERCGWKCAFVLVFGKTNKQELLLAAHSSEQEKEWMTTLNSIITSTLEWHSHSSS